MELIKVIHKDGIVELSLNRPKVNAMSRALLRELKQAFDAARDDDAAKGVLVCGEGKCLSAGLDLKEVGALDATDVSDFLDEMDAAFGAAFMFPKPMAVAVHGHAIAGGLILALCADFLAFKTGQYKLGLTELAVGVPFPRVAFEAVRLAMPPRALRKLVNEAGTHPPAEVFELGVGDVLVDDPVAAAKTWLGVVTSRPAGVFRFVKMEQRKEAWERAANTPLAERQALVKAMMAARDELRAE